MRLRFTRSALTAMSALVALGGCAAILDIEPTQVIDASSSTDAGGTNEGGTNEGGTSEGGTPFDGGTITPEGGTSTDGGATPTTPAFTLTCASSITNIDPNSKEANAIVADETGLFWAIPFNASVGEIFARVGGVTTVLAGNDSADSTKSEPSVIGMALDAGYLYWTSWNTYNGDLGTAHLREWSRMGHTIANADLSGLAGTGVSEIALADGKLFYGNWLSVAQNGHFWSIAAPFADGTMPHNVSGGLDSALHFASDGLDAVYYDESSLGDAGPQDEVGVASAAGGNPEEIDKTVNSVEDLAVGDSSRVYWAQTQDGKIRSHLPGLDAGTDDFVTIAYPHLLAYDKDHQMLYVIHSSQDNVWSLHRFSTTSSSPVDELCVDNLNDASAIQYTNGHVYFSATSDTHTDGLFDLTIK